MQDYHTNIAFNQLPLVAFSLDSHEPVRVPIGLHCA